MKYTLKKSASLIDTVLEIYQGISRQKAKQIISHSEFIKNGEKIDHHPTQLLEKGDFLEINKLEINKDKNVLPNRNNPVALYFEDDHLIVALKPAGILSCGSKTDKNNKSFHKVLEEYLQMRDETKRRLWIVHRLDKEVEGLILFAKSENVQVDLKDNWQQVTKKYLAITEKKPDPASGIIENWLRDADEQKVIGFDSEVPNSKFAKTEYNYLRAENPTTSLKYNCILDEKTRYGRIYQELAAQL